MKTNVGIFFGGPSEEFEVSLTSTRTFLSEIDKSKYSYTLIGIDKKGLWHITDELLFMTEGRPFYDVCAEVFPKIDVAFPLCHGPFGEDGAIQGLFRVAGIPFVGADVLGSAVGMDKDVMKRLIRDANLPYSPFEVLHSKQDIANLSLQLPLIVKPANMGSSVGIRIAYSDAELFDAVDYAFEYDKKVIVESVIEGREFECSVMGINDPIASLPGELIPKDGFYDYDNKYVHEDGARFVLPAPIPEDEVATIQDLAVKTFKALCCEIMARVDFLRDREGNYFVNEINTIPGFTPISLFPQLWMFSNISYTQLISKLIDQALERSQKMVSAN